MNDTRILPEIGKVYKHYRGERYKVLAIGRIESTREPVVIYQHEGFPSQSHTWVRPTREWWEKFEVEHE